jgi:hypothetical protein
MSVLAMKTESERFKKAIIISISIHMALLIFLIVSPYLPKPKRKGMIHYVSIYSLPGGGGGGGGEEAARLETTSEEVVETPAPPRETLKDLTTPPKMEEQAASTLRHPVENPKKEKAPPSEKKAVIEKQQPSTKTASPVSKESGSSEGSGSGSGIKFGTGSGSGGGGPESLSQIGLSNFRFTYYLRHIENKISSNWVKSYTGPEKLYTEVVFRIYRNGEVGPLKVEVSCSVPSLDRTAVRAIYSSSPFAPLPQGYQYDYLEIQLIFEH